MIAADIDECQGPNDCQQQCENTEGSYTCSCTEGFTLNIDSRSCVGKLLHTIIILCFNNYDVHTSSQMLMNAQCSVHVLKPALTPWDPSSVPVGQDLSCKMTHPLVKVILIQKSSYIVS